VDLIFWTTILISVNLPSAMAYVADLHIHSKYAGACSGALNVPNLAIWAKLKGIDLLGTGDALHPLYYQELLKDLKEVGGGLYEQSGTKFVVSAEVSGIYSEYGKTRRIHILILFPSLEAAGKVAEVLTQNGAKLSSDGRPILGMSSKKICEIVFSQEPKALIIPAHIWTPWFSLYGSNSGFDKFKDCFGEFSNLIYAVETGLSSEPAMNWRVGDLDNKSIVSFSDLHSLPRMGRECTIFGGSLSFEGLTNALINQNIVGTIEFYPEEGKYHYSGHRNCGVVLSPEDLKAQGSELCPKCGRKLTIGVMERVEELATREQQELGIINQAGIFKSELFPERGGFRMLVQLEEIISESLGVAVKTQSVQNLYQNLVKNVDTELKILIKTPLEMIALTAGERVAEGVKRVREGQLTIEPGFDNTYGKVKIFSEDEESLSSTKEPVGLF
jgi:uncharacterized protein (TIGR00375 family)